MNIALIHRYYSLRGAITPLLDASIKEYSKLGVRFTLFSENLKSEEKKAFPFLGAPRFYWQLFKKLKKSNFDLILTHSYPVCFLKLLIKTPIVLVVHNTGKEEFAVEKNNLFYRFRSWVSAFFRCKSFRFADKLIVVSEMVKDILLKNYNIKPSKIIVINNGVDTRLFKPRKIKRTNKKFIILHRGTDSRKGFDLLIKWVPEIISTMPFVKFLILGKRRTCLYEKISSHLKFIEWVDYKKMPEIYSSVDLVICPSKYDPFPGVVIEAMSCQKPVLMSDKCGTKELIKQGQNGFVSDLNTFKQKLIKVGSMKKSELKIIGKNARKTILKKLRWENIIKKQLSEFNKLIKKDF